MKYLPSAIGALASLVVVCGGVRAEELAPFAGRSVVLGEMRGIAYYRPDDAGFEVVITLADGPTGRPVRLVTTLTPGQATAISAPGMAGLGTTSITITRNGDRLFVDDRLARAEGHEVVVDPGVRRSDTRG
jgi:hypothetical protein